MGRIPFNTVPVYTTSSQFAVRIKPGDTFKKVGTTNYEVYDRSTPARTLIKYKQTDGFWKPEVDNKDLYIPELDVFRGQLSEGTRNILPDNGEEGMGQLVSVEATRGKAQSHWQVDSDEEGNIDDDDAEEGTKQIPTASAEKNKSSKKKRSRIMQRMI